MAHDHCCIPLCNNDKLYESGKDQHGLTFSAAFSSCHLTSNMDISGCRFAEEGTKLKSACRKCITLTFLHSTNHILSLLACSCRYRFPPGENRKVNASRENSPYFRDMLTIPAFQSYKEGTDLIGTQCCTQFKSARVKILCVL